jgi:hypothetical protein
VKGLLKMTNKTSLQVDISSEMIDAGVKRLYEFHITEPNEDEMRSAVAEMYKVMYELR